jgi:hypothetical protein
MPEQNEELEQLNFERAKVRPGGLSAHYNAKCKECRVFVDVPTNSRDGAGEDARVHYDWHVTLRQIIKEITDELDG